MLTVLVANYNNSNPNLLEFLEKMQVNKNVRFIIILLDHLRFIEENLTLETQLRIVYG